MHSIHFLVGGRFFSLFLYRPGSSLYTMGFPSSLLFFVNIYLLSLPIKNKLSQVVVHWDQAPVDTLPSRVSNLIVKAILRVI